MLDRVHGITYNDLQTKPVVSFEEAQTSVLKFIGYELRGRVSRFVHCDVITSDLLLFVCLRRCSKDSILVGHSLYGDLDCLKLRHELVVDTAFTFTVKVPITNSPYFIIGLCLRLCALIVCVVTGIFLVNVYVLWLCVHT